MTSSAAALRLLGQLDWAGEVDAPIVLEPAAVRLRATAGPGVLRWIGGTVESFIPTFNREVGDSFASRNSFRRFARQFLLSTLTSLIDDAPPTIDGIERDSDIIADLALRQVEIADLSASLRLMQRDTLIRLLDEARRVEPESSLISSIAMVVCTTMDQWIEWLSAATLRERERLAEHATTRARETVTALLAGEAVAPAVVEAELHRPLESWHVCLAIGAAAAGVQVDRDEVAAIAARFGSALGDAAPLQYATATGDTFVWASVAAYPAAPADAVVAARSDLALGVGTPQFGAAGFRKSHREAEDALRFAVAMGVGAPVDYADAALPILLTREEERARAFVEDELGELADDTPEMSEMRETLRAFFALRMRIAPAAEQLYLHRNTLINRLDRIEGILGHTLAERTPEVQAALAIMSWWERKN